MQRLARPGGRPYGWRWPLQLAEGRLGAIVLTSNTYEHVLEQRQQEMARGMDAVLGG
jgi:hypothetical protein